MIVKTKKYQLETEQFIKLGMLNIAKEWWWAWLIPIAILLIGAIWMEMFWWFFGIAITLTTLYALFWGIQFAGITQHEQGKMFLQRLSYEIDSRQILIKLDAKRGMPLSWEQIKGVKKTKDGYMFKLSLVQFIYLPFTVFRNENDRRFLEALLRRKNFLKSDETAEKDTSSKKK